MPRLVLKALLLLLPLLALMACINFSIDPARLFSDDRTEREIAALLVSGKAVVVNTFDQLAFHRRHIALLPKAPQIAVFGSSRAMLLRSSTLAGRDLINSSFTRQRLIQLLTVYELYVINQKTPDVVVIGVDPFMLFDVPGAKPTREYLHALRRLNLPMPKGSTEEMSDEKPKALEVNSWPALQALFSPSYLQSSMRDVLFFGAAKRSTAIRGLDLSEVDKYLASGEPGLKYPDGSWEYPKKWRNQTESEARAAAIHFGKDPLGENDFKSCDPEAQHVFEVFLDGLLKEGKKVVFFLCPYHPMAYREMRAAPSDFLAGPEEYYRRVATQHQIEVVGSYDPEKCNCGEADFYDQYHLRPNGIARMFSTLPKAVLI